MCRDRSRDGPDANEEDRGNAPTSNPPAPHQPTHVGSAFDHDNPGPGRAQLAVPAVVIQDSIWFVRGARVRLIVLGQPDGGQRRRYLEKLLFTGGPDHDDQANGDQATEDQATEDQA